MCTGLYLIFPQPVSRAGKMGKLPARIETYQPQKISNQKMKAKPLWFWVNGLLRITSMFLEWSGRDIIPLQSNLPADNHYFKWVFRAFALGIVMKAHILIRKGELIMCFNNHVTVPSLTAIRGRFMKIIDEFYMIFLVTALKIFTRQAGWSFLKLGRPAQN